MTAFSPLRPRRPAGAALAAALALSGCARAGDERPPQAGDRAVAKVDGQVIWTSDVRQEAEAEGLVAKGEPLPIDSDVFAKTLDRVIDRKLLAAEALRRGLERDAVTQRRLANARERVLGDRVVETAVADAVSETAVQGLYKEQLKAAGRAEQIRARQIVTANRGDAEAVLKLLGAGGAFEPLALERSIDTATRFNGGDLGYFTLNVMPPAYAVALSDARPGAVVGPFEVKGRWVVVQVEDRRSEPPMSLAAARPQIVRFLAYDRIRDLLTTLRSHARVETLVKSTPPHSPPAQEGRS